jgi:hypothetical protein
MTSLHEMLKTGKAGREEKQAPQVDLRGRYSKLGLSAVAAAAPYRSAAEDCKAEHAAEHQALRGWTRRDS